MVNKNEQPLMHHLVELRRRLIICIIAIAFGTVIAFSLHKVIISAILGPAAEFADMAQGKPIFTELTEFIGITMKISILGGIVIAIPVIIYHGLMFVNPGITRKERIYIFAGLPVTIAAFLSGVTFGYFILLPPAINFLLTFGSDLATPLIRIGNYVSLTIMLLFWMGLSFETPVIMFLLAKLGVVRSSTFARQRRFAVVGAFILAAVITPTFDPINQTIVAIPIIILYEIGIWLAKLARKEKAK